MANTINNVEHRNFNCEVRAKKDSTDGAYLEGIPIVFNKWTNMGWYDEIIADGALSKTDLSDVCFLVNHNNNALPLARARKGRINNTMSFSVIKGLGMKIKVKLDIKNNADARALYSAVERGDITSMSFAFLIDTDSWEDIDSNHPKRTITSIKKVTEVSAVTWPAYEQTSLSIAKSSLERAKELKEFEFRKQKIRILSMI